MLAVEGIQEALAPTLRAGPLPWGSSSVAPGKVWHLGQLVAWHPRWDCSYKV